MWKTPSLIHYFLVNLLCFASSWKKCILWLLDEVGFILHRIMCKNLFFHSFRTLDACSYSSRDDNRAGRVQRMGSLPPPRIVLSYPIPTPPHMTGKIFFPHPHPLGPCKTPSHPVKLYFLLICPQLLQLFLIKHVLFIKIYLKLQINLSHQIKLTFSKNWIILLKYLTRQYHNKNKNLKIQNQWFNSI